jgi:hypothetical protein
MTEISSDNSTGFFRLKTIIGDQNAVPPIKPIIPVSRSAWWQGIRDGRYPSGVKIGPRTTAWLQSDIKDLCSRLSGGQK